MVTAEEPPPSEVVTYLAVASTSELNLLRIQGPVVVRGW